MDTVATWIRGILSALLLILAGWWLYMVASNLSIAPQTNSSGEVVLDSYQRAKDILLVVFPLLTTALGYWFGAAGKEKAEEKADSAQTQLTSAQTQLAEVVDQSAVPGILEKAKAANPKAFGLE